MDREKLREEFAKKAKAGDGAFAVAWALMDLADSQEATAGAIQRLGNAGASTPYGAIENLSMQLMEIGSALRGLQELTVRKVED